ncbi:MAG: phosphodiester glycosidase family protein, partial [Clostridiales bacterium]|nr:phosphodiester glycosidase family protein [Clostridiales bacterium]
MRKALLLFSSFVSILLMSVPALANNIIYEHRQQTVLAKDVTYELNRQITEDGMLEIHVLTVPLNDPHMYIGPVTSGDALGLKESTSKLLSDAGAVAGVNGDFFGVAGRYSVPFGPVIADGSVRAVSSTTNQNKNEFAAFMLDGNNNPIMKYLRAEIHFYNNGAENIEIGNYNKVGVELDWPVIIDRQYMPDTTYLDSRFSGLWKIVVENRSISYISQLSEKVTIPEGGYAIVIPSSLYNRYRTKFNVGESAEFNLGNNIGVTLASLKSAIGGGGLVLENGVTVHDSGTVIRGRQPRTAVGVSQDKTKLIIMAVDGRTHSIGASHDELAALLLRYGAWNAMHLDGGGSTTMVYKEPDSDEYILANTPSDGAQRRIINALGIFDRSPVGGALALDVHLSQERVFAGTPVIVQAVGIDPYGHMMPLPDAETRTTLYADPATDGAWQGSSYYPTKSGLQTVQVIYEGRNAWKYLWVYDIAELQCSTDAIRTLEGMSTPLSFSGIATDGTEVPADNGVRVTVVPENLGVWQNGEFTATSTGAGYLECSVGNVTTYVKLTVGGFSQPYNAFGTQAGFEGYPAGVSGYIRAEQVGEKFVTRMSYFFPTSGATQAAYVVFNQPVDIQGDPMALRLSVLGDGSGDWLRGRITDATGEEYAIDFERNVESMDWHQVTAMIPEEAQAPIKLERVYMAATESGSDRTSMVYLDSLAALYEPDYTVDVPEGQKFTDPLKSAAIPPADASVFTIPTAVSGYTVQKSGSTAVFTITASKGGIMATNRQQWAHFEADIEANMPEAIVVMMDTNPLNFTQKKELELFESILSYHRNMLDRPVFVVSATGTETTLVMRDGIRYI